MRFLNVSRRELYDFSKKKNWWSDFFFGWSNFRKIWKSLIFEKSRIFEKSNFLNFLKKIFAFHKENSKFQIFRKSEIFRFLRKSEIFRFFENSISWKKNLIIKKKVFFEKISKIHRKTFQEHPAIPSYSPWARRTSPLDLGQKRVLADFGGIWCSPHGTPNTILGIFRPMGHLWAISSPRRKVGLI